MDQRSIRGPRWTSDGTFWTTRQQADEHATSARLIRRYFKGSQELRVWFLGRALVEGLEGSVEGTWDLRIAGLGAHGAHWNQGSSSSWFVFQKDGFVFGILVF